MHRVPGGFACPKCKNQVDDRAVQVTRIERRDSSTVHVIDDSEAEYVKVRETCPQCGNREAFRRVLFVSGEHAGIRQERSVEHLKCTRCSHSWSKV